VKTKELIVSADGNGENSPGRTASEFAATVSKLNPQPPGFVATKFKTCEALLTVLNLPCSIAFAHGDVNQIRSRAPRFERQTFVAQETALRGRCVSGQRARRPRKNN